MPIIKSAVKRVRRTKRQTLKNRIFKDRLAEEIKKFEKLLEEKEHDAAKELYPRVQKLMDLAVKKNIWHAKKAGHKKSRFSKMISGAAGMVKKAATATAEKAGELEKKYEEKEEKKPAAKKPAAKKAAAKKTTPKKSTKK
ncbi:MAG: 30S ribosomal protein S20 [Candidatus Gracilibacteria bacterium]|nr:30S ribosomal protein S20 [Candidatus Gracilibacteria bacterium]